MSRPAEYRVAIIGGGLSGLATAVKLHLADPTLQLTLFESSERVGGVIHTESAKGFLIDHGADMFASNPPAAIDLCRQIGLQDRLIEPQPNRRGARIVRHGKLVPIPEGFVIMRATQWWPMLTTPLLGIGGKLRFFLERWVRPRAEDYNADESVATFVRRRMGKQVLDRIVAPLAAGIYTSDVTKLSMRATMGPIAEMERKYGSLAQATSARRRSGEDSVERASTGARYGQFRALAGGMIELIEGLAKALPAETIQLGTPVISLEQHGTKWHLKTADMPSDSEPGSDVDRPLEYDHVIVAVPPKPAARLLAEIAPAAASELQSIESASTAIVVLGVRRGDIARDIETFGFVVPLSEHRKILAGSFASHKFAGRAPEGHVLIRVFLGGAMQPQLLDLGDQQLVQLVRQELREIIGLEGEPLVTRVVRWNEAMPQYHVGHMDKVAKIEQALDKIDGLTLVSNALHGVGIAPVIRLADRVAKELVASFTPSSDSSCRDGVDSGHATQ